MPQALQKIKPSIIYECPICKEQVFYMMTRTGAVKHFRDCFESYVTKGGNSNED